MHMHKNQTVAFNVLFLSALAVIFTGPTVLKGLAVDFDPQQAQAVNVIAFDETDFECIDADGDEQCDSLPED